MRIVESELSALGRSLRPIDASLMKPADTSAEKQRFWYQGKEPYFDIQLEMLAEEITWLQITLRGKALTWRSPNYLQTGETDELDVPPEVAYYAASKIIRDGAAINWQLVDFMEKMLTERGDDPILVKIRQKLAQQLEHHHKRLES